MFKCETCGRIINIIYEGDKGVDVSEILCCGKPVIKYKGIDVSPAEFRTPKDAINFAIKREEEAYKFYTDLAKKSERPGMKNVFKELAGEEKKHKSQLLTIKNSSKEKFMQITPKKIIDLRFSDYLQDISPSEDLTYQQALILAIKREKEAYNLYSSLAKISKDAKLVSIFNSLANMEAGHKMRLEIEYDDFIFTEN